MKALGLSAKIHCMSANNIFKDPMSENCNHKSNELEEITATVSTFLILF